MTEVITRSHLECICYSLNLDWNKAMVLSRRERLGLNWFMRGESVTARRGERDKVDYGEKPDVSRIRKSRVLCRSNGWLRKR